MTGWIDEAKTYVGFSAEDERHLRTFHSVARVRYVEVIDHFYDEIDHHEGTRRVITGGDAQIARLKKTLITWLETGLGGGHDLAWFDARMRIGRRHVEVGLASHFMFNAMSLIRSDLHRVAREVPGLEVGPTVDAIDRWLDLELAIMLESYQESAQAEKLSAMQRLSAGLAHEVRNPLNAAQLQLELLARRLRRAGVDRGLLEVTALVDDEIRRLSGLLQEFLDFARPARIAAADTDLVGLASGVIALAAPTARDRNIAVTLGGDRTVVIACDPGKVRQILHNLVANAIDAAASRVEVLLGVDDDVASIRVIDDGAGIPDSVLPRIYDPFFSTKERGTGMGLSITYSMVMLHGGQITARNRAGGGAEFTVTLPIVQA